MFQRQWSILGKKIIFDPHVEAGGIMRKKHNCLHIKELQLVAFEKNSFFYFLAMGEFFLRFVEYSAQP